MPSPKLICSAVSDAMNIEQKEGHASLDTFIRQAVGKEPLFSFSQTGESPIQWIQLLHALDQQGHNKLSKGPQIDNVFEERERSSLEQFNGVSSFTSKVNGNKESVSNLKGNGVTVKGRKTPSDHLQALKIPEAVIAFAQAAAKANGEAEKYLPGWPLLFPPKPQMQKCDKCTREFCSPINYRRHVRVHQRLLNADKVPRKNRECLGAFWDKLSVDEAKELVSFKNVTLEDVTGSSISGALSSLVRKPGFSSLPQLHKSRCRTLGTAVSLEKFIFNGEAGKIALEMRNLVKAWVDDKDAEALRCHKMLVEEEAAAQRRQAEMQKRKRLKKLRQKENKAKDQLNISQTVAECRESSPDTVVDMSFSMITSSQEAVSDTDSNPQEALLDHNQAYLGSVSSVVRLDIGTQTETSEHVQQTKYADTGGDTKVWKRVESGVSHIAGSRRSGRKYSRNSGYKIQYAQIPVLRSSMMKKRPALLNSADKVWTRKSKLEAAGRDSGACVSEEFKHQVNRNDKFEVLIGSISVALGECSSIEQTVRQNSSERKLIVKDSGVQHLNVQSSLKLWRPVAQHDIGAPVMAQENMLVSEVDGSSARDTVQGVDVVSSAIFKPLSRHTAEVFLLQRWKVAIGGEHVKLVLSSRTEQQGPLVADEPSSTNINGNSQCTNGNAEKKAKSSSTKMAGNRPNSEKRVKEVYTKAEK